MNSFGLEFHHLGLAVKTPGRALAMLAALGYRKGRDAYDPLQRVNLAMFHHAEMPDVEVIWPGEGPSPIDNIVRKSDGRVYHLCYAAADPERTIKAMEAEGLEIVQVAAPEPAVLFDGRPVSFYSVVGFGLIELIDCRGAPPP